MDVTAASYRPKCKVSTSIHRSGLAPDRDDFVKSSRFELLPYLRTAATVWPGCFYQRSLNSQVSQFPNPSSYPPEFHANSRKSVLVEWLAPKHLWFVAPTQVDLKASATMLKGSDHLSIVWAQGLYFNQNTGFHWRKMGGRQGRHEDCRNQWVLVSLTGQLR